MAKAEEILNKFPKKMLIGIIVSLAGIIGSGGYFVYEKYMDVDYTPQIDSLKYQIFILKNKDISKDAVIYELKKEIKEGNVKLKAYTDNQIKFVVKNTESKNAKIMLDLLESQRDQPDIIEYVPSPTKDTIYIHTVEKQIIEKTVLVKDSVEKKGLLKRILNK
jgi:hypothetical protein